MLHTTELTTSAAMKAVRDPWRALALASQHDTPYALPELMLPLMERLDGSHSFRAVAVWDGQTMVGFAPLAQRRIGRLGVGLSMRGFPEIAPAPPCDVLVRQGVTGVAASLFEHWLADDQWDVIEFANVPPDSSVMSCLARLAIDAGLLVTSTEGLEYHYVEVTTPWAEYLASRSKKMRQNLRRGLHYCERFGNLAFPVYPGDMTLAQAQERITTVLARSWKNEPAGPQRWNKFPCELAAGLDRADLVSLRFLDVDGTPAAYLLDVPFKSSIFAVHNAYDLKYHPGNPGQLLLERSIRHAHDNGIQRYVTGNRDYLRHWSRFTMPTVRMRILRRGALARAKLAAYDWMHARRSKAALHAVEHQKGLRKDSARVSGKRRSTAREPGTGD